MNKKNFIAFSALLSLTILGACASTGKTEQAKIIEDTRTVLDVHQAQVKQVEARILINGFNGQLTNVEMATLKEFATDYARLGRGNMVISYPRGGVMDGATDALVRATQKELYIQGVNFDKMSFGSYQASQTQNPIVLSFARYEAQSVECKPWSQIDLNKISANQASERFGCAKAANLAAMIVDPGDLTGDRKEDLPDAERTQKALDDYHKGKIEQVSGSVTGGKN